MNNEKILKSDYQTDIPNKEKIYCMLCGKRLYGWEKEEEMCENCEEDEFLEDEEVEEICPI